MRQRFSSRSSVVRRGAAVLAAAAFAVGMAVAVPGTAQAVPLPECHGTTHLHEGNEYNELPTTSPGSWNINCVLGPGDGYAGDQLIAVQVLQRSLQKCYGQDLGPAGADGKYGSRTQEGVRNVQRFHNQTENAGLVVDGIYGPKTASRMEFINSLGRCWTLS
jgi:peptidoglycan hydrolase-like protein with peptidoglycan-binding domain